jgi:hypothetical protein
MTETPLSELFATYTEQIQYSPAYSECTATAPPYQTSKILWRI